MDTKALEESLITTILTAFQNNEIDYFSFKAASKFIFNNISRIKSEQDKKVVLGDLTKRWPIFAEVAVIENQDDEKQQEQKVINKLETYIKQFPTK